jgi:CRP/FNR family transcriptional regulator, dissimilatory nitrate respiration regulator
LDQYRFADTVQPMTASAIDTGQLREIHLLAGLDDDELARVSRTMRQLRLEMGQRLFDFGQPAVQFFYLETGQLKLFRNSPDGGEKIIWIVEPGETFAEAAMFLEFERGYPVSAEALMSSLVLAFDSRTMVEILRGSTETCIRMLGTMSMRLRHQINEVQKLTLHNATYRLASYLLHQMPVDVMECPEVQLGTSKNVIASRLSIQPETFSRILARLIKKGLLEVHGQNIVVLDIDGLRRLVQF